MTGAMYAAVSGLKTHMQNLNVIGHNIANVNTQGYKAGRSIFDTALYTSVRGGANGTATVGGRNPSQIGYGSALASVDIDMSTSTYIPTGKPMDHMIDGDGFFLIGETKDLEFRTPEDFKKLTLTRVGDLEFKADGFLSNHAGNVVYGFQCVGLASDGITPVVSNQLGPIQFPKITPDGQIMYTQEHWDSYKTAKLAQLNAQQPPNANEIALYTNLTYNTLPQAEFDSISIDEATGKISGIVKDTDQNVTIGFLAIGNVTNPNGVTQLSGTYYKCGDGAGEMSVSILGGGAREIMDSAVMQLTGAGGTGNIYDFDTTSGTITGNGLWSLRDQTATIDTAKGLGYVNGDSTMTGMQVHTGGTTKLIGSGLEQTNVDLATEISNMITTQRGYQANTRIVTVTDSMLEELINMKR